MYACVCMLNQIARNFLLKWIISFQDINTSLYIGIDILNILYLIIQVISGTKEQQGHQRPSGYIETKHVL